MKNFGSACEISLLNLLEFIPSSRENDIAKITLGAICKVIAFSNRVITFAPPCIYVDEENLTYSSEI